MSRMVVAGLGMMVGMLIMSQAASSAEPSFLTPLNRYLGWGWSDGYHVRQNVCWPCGPSGFAPGMPVSYPALTAPPVPMNVPPAMEIPPPPIDRSAWSRIRSAGYLHPSPPTVAPPIWHPQPRVQRLPPVESG
jgi:hypothetical protein